MKRLVTPLQTFFHYGIAALLVGMPFHALVVTVSGNFLGNRAIWQSWKEVLIVLLTSAALWLFWQNKKRNFSLHAANIAALLVIVLGVAITLFARVDVVQALFGYKVVLLPIVLYLIVQLADARLSEEHLLKLVLWPSYIVATLAILQEFFIPLSWWSALGYNDSTIRPLQLVDPAVKSIRAFASLGGPNQLGAYLIFPTILSLVYALRSRKWQYGVGALVLLTGLITSFSRSAWIGLIVALFAAIFIFGNKLVRLITVTLVAIGVGLLFSVAQTLPARLSNTQAQYFLLHGRYNDAREIEGSDYGRIQALNKAVDSIKDHPWGNGLGTAGPASFVSSQPVITENWYLQIVIEIGLIGLVLFAVFFLDNLIPLVRSQSFMAKALAASLCGLLVTNMFLHAWADSTLGIIIFLMMGMLRSKKA